MIESFRMGGWGMWPTLVIGALMIAVSLRYAVRPESRLVPLIVSTGLLTLTSGALGFVTGLIATTTHLAEIEASRSDIFLIGFGESLNNVGLALILGAVAMIAVAAGAARTGHPSSRATA